MIELTSIGLRKKLDLVALTQNQQQPERFIQ